jgi:hypothetical protein
MKMTFRTSISLFVSSGLNDIFCADGVTSIYRYQETTALHAPPRDGTYVQSCVRFAPAPLVQSNSMMFRTTHNIWNYAYRIRVPTRTLRFDGGIQYIITTNHTHTHTFVHVETIARSNNNKNRCK